MDNLPVRKVAGVRQAIETAGASVKYLPPYRPDFNPIERASAKFKSLLRAAQARASGEPPTPFAASPRKNAQTISPPQDTMQRERKML
jgi:hypothetical protein